MNWIALDDPQKQEDGGACYPRNRFTIGTGAGGDEADHLAHRRQSDEIGMREQPHVGQAGQFLRSDPNEFRKLVANEA